MLTISVASMTTLSVYLAPLLALMISFDAIAGDADRGSLGLLLTYPAGRGEVLLGKFFALSEAYPDVKSNQNMMQLSEELTTTENKVAFSRQAFNDAVTEYNTYKQSFPAVMLANTFGHSQDAKLLEFEDREQIQQAPSISF